MGSKGKQEVVHLRSLVQEVESCVCGLVTSPEQGANRRREFKGDCNPAKGLKVEKRVL